MNPTFQTIRLSRGQHASPADGACVMELASMLAGEQFSDHPRSVCPVIAMTLRAYNDGTTDARRQDLYRCASLVVGTRDRGARRARLARCEEFFRHRLGGRPLLFHARVRALGCAALAYARTADDARHERFLRFVDELAGEDADIRAADAEPGKRDVPSRSA